MNDTINFKCPHCGAFPLALEAGKRVGYNPYCAVCSVCKKEVDNYRALMYVGKEHVTITISKEEYYDLRIGNALVNSLNIIYPKNMIEMLLDGSPEFYEYHKNKCKEIHKEIFGE